MQAASLATPRFASLETTELAGWEAVNFCRPPWAELFAPTTPHDALWELGEASLDDLGTAWFQRDPSEADETWRALQKYDSRVLQQLDAVLGVGHSLLERLQARSEELNTPSDWFGQVFVLANIKDRCAELLLRETLERLDGAEVEAHQACTEALAASAHPDLGRLGSPETTAAAAWAAVLRARVLREQITEVEILQQASTHEHPTVLAAVASALYRWAALSPQSYYALEKLLQHDDEEVVRHALVSGGIVRMGAAYQRALQLCECLGPGYADSALAAVLHAWRRTGSCLTDLWQRSPSAELAEAMARHGDPSLIPFLIAQLEAGEQPEACAAALGMLTGARLIDERLVPVYEREERLFADDPDARVAVSELTTEPGPWSDYWSANSSSLQTVSRVRFGRPYGVAMLVAQMEAGTGNFLKRAYTQLELQALSGGQAPYGWVRDWFPRQARSMQQVRAWAAGSAGRFPGEGRPREEFGDARA